MVRGEIGIHMVAVRDMPRHSTSIPTGLGEMGGRLSICLGTLEDILLELGNRVLIWRSEQKLGKGRYMYSLTNVRPMRSSYISSTHSAGSFYTFITLQRSNQE
jgi:hypothetical protein